MKVLKSKTINFSIMLAILGAVEMNLHLLQNRLGEDYGVVYIFISAIVAVLRVKTTGPLSDK